MTTKEICTICLGEVENRGKIACEHEFCLQCIHDWSKVTNVCPVCKKAFTKITAVDTPKIRGEKRKASSQKEIKVVLIGIDCYFSAFFPHLTTLKRLLTTFIFAPIDISTHRLSQLEIGTIKTWFNYYP
jgi:Ring finger domain